MGRKNKRQKCSNLDKARATRWTGDNVESEANTSCSVPNTENNTVFNSGDAPSCTFAKKLKLSEPFFVPKESKQSERVIVDLDLLQNFINNYQCSMCGQSAIILSVSNGKSKGFAKFIEASCSKCNEKNSFYSSRVDDQSTSKCKPFKINNDIVAASLSLDMGPYKLNKFCEFVNFPSIHHKSYQKIARRLQGEMKMSSISIFRKAADIVRLYHKKDQHDKSPLQIEVSFDGSWLTRGHTSLIGLGSVIEVHTGMVLDLHVLSLHCSTCAKQKEIMKNEPTSYEEWLIHHRQKGCSINYTGTSGMMEAEAAAVLWSRSMELHNFQYTKMVGDGDSKAFDRITAAEPYGKTITIEKEECINHVSKRLGTALRNLVQDCSKKGVTLGGKKRGSLTADKIRKLSIYYSRAIRGNKTAEEMKKAIKASLHHNYSTDDYPQHQFCPPGKDSWCFYKRDVSEHRYPGGHSKRVHNYLDYERLHKYVGPIYERLSDLKLLKRCELRTTQNNNESLHNMIWSRCNKSKFHCKEKVEFSAISAIAEYNFGPLYAMEFTRSNGKQSKKLCAARQQKRLKQSESALSGLQKERQKKRKIAKEKADKEHVQVHGTTGYGAGDF